MSARRWIGSAWAIGLVPSALAAQLCTPSKSSNEAKLLATFAVPLAFSQLGALEAAPAERVRVGLEMYYLPTADSISSIPNICRPGKLEGDNTDLLFAAPRPRLAIALGRGWAVEGSWTPPVRLSGVKANLVGFALSKTSRLGHGGAVLSLSGHGTFGVVHAPVTCDDRRIALAGSECFGGTRSDDAYHPNVAGIDASIGWTSSKKLQPYFGAGYNHLAPRFRVHFVNSDGVLDQQRVEVDLDRIVVFAGATWRAASKLGVSGEIYAAPADAVTGRVAVRLGL
ncbi:MAG: hypothetical protein ABI647_00555 [Gemmatimonadota bacterium]